MNYLRGNQTEYVMCPVCDTAPFLEEKKLTIKINDRIKYPILCKSCSKCGYRVEIKK